MKKGILLIFLLLFLVFFFTKNTLAQMTSHGSGGMSITSAMGGKITFVPALQIGVLKSSGFVCNELGTTFDITPATGAIPTGPYLAPFGVIGRGGGNPAIGKYIIGLFNFIPVPITCIHPSGAIQIVNAFPLILYGTSKI